MDAAERIADYLSDDLAPDEREAFEAELARDAALRAQLDAATRANAALASVAPTEVPDGFADRLRTALDAELRDVLAPVTATEPDPRVAAQGELGRHDELAARRAARAMPRWVGGLAGAAAAVLVVVAGVAGLNSLGGGADDGAESASGEAFDTDGGADDGAMDAQAESFDAAEEAQEGEAETTQEAPTEELEAEDEAAGTLRAADQPVLVAEGRAITDDELDDILLTPELTELAARQLRPDEGRSLAAEYLDRWQAAATDDAGGEATILGTGAATAEDRQAVARCLTSAAEAGRAEGIAAFVEIAEYEGLPVVVLGLVTLDPDTDTWSVPAVQLLDRSSCDLLAARP